MNDQLLSHFVSILNDILSAFRKVIDDKRFFIRCIEDWKTVFVENKRVVVLSIDLSRAFDCSPHSLRLAKFRAYGLDISACNLIASYLPNRKQRVYIGNARIEWISLSKGCLKILSLVRSYSTLLLTIKTCSRRRVPNTIMQMIALLCSPDDRYSYIESPVRCQQSYQVFIANGMQARPEEFRFAMISRGGDCSRSLILHDGSVSVSDDHVNCWWL